MKKFFVAASALAACVGFNSASAATIIYSDQSAFQAATDTTVEDFADQTLIGGLALDSQPSNAANKYAITGGKLIDTVSGNSGSLAFNFDEGQTAFGGIFDLVTDSSSTAGLTVTATFGNSSQIIQTILPTCSGCFFGFTSDTAFNQVILTPTLRTSGTSEKFSLDNLEIGSVVAAAPPEVGAVPEPATWAMMLFGFGAVGFGMRRRRSNSGQTRVRYAF